MRGNYWEQRKALHLASYSKGKGYSKDDLTESGTPVILYGRLYTKYESVIEEVDTFVDASNDGIYSHGDEVIVPASGETAEDIARASAVAQPGVLFGGDLNILRPNKSITSLFMALSLSNGTAQKELSKRAQGKSVVHVHNSDIQDVTISYPTIDEQTQIGAFFRSLDSLITLHQREGISAYKEAFVLTHQRNKFVRDVILLRLLLPGTIHAVKRMVLLIHPLRPAILASAEHEDSSSAGTGKLVIVPERDDFVRIAENLLALLIHTGVFRYRMGKVNLGTSQNRKPTRVLVVFTNALDAIASRMEHRANLGPSINSIKVETQGGHPEQHVIVQSLDVVFGIWAHVRFGNF